MTTAPAGPARLVLAWDESMARYDFGPTHPMQPVRLRLTMALARELGLLDLPGVLVEAPHPAADEELRAVHTAELLSAVRSCSDGRPSPGAVRHGLGSADNPVFAGMHEAAARAVGGTLLAMRAVLSGRARVGVNLAGGLHHAMADAASGFCVYNDLAVAIADALAAGVERIAYVDTDVHHGDGVQAAFAADPRVLTVSLHQDPATLWPGTGDAADTGAAEGAGTAVNVPLPAGTGDAGWRRAFDAVVPPVLRAFRPQLLVTQHGCDTHRQDPIGGLALSVDGQRAVAADLAALADELCAGRWVATGGGGYALHDVVPRSWAHLVGVAAGRPVPVETPLPTSWRARRDGSWPVDGWLPPPSATAMGDGVDPGYRRFGDGVDPVDRIIRSVRQAALPAFGLDPAGS